MFVAFIDEKDSPVCKKTFMFPVSFPCFVPLLSYIYTRLLYLVLW